MSLLVDDNENYPDVQWTTPISKLIREDFVLENEYWTEHITIEDALSHRTGMARHDLSYGGTGAVPRDIVRSLRYLPLTWEPRTEWHYCNLMFVVISHVIETLTGEWLGDYMHRRIWKALKMHSTFFSLQQATKSGKPIAKGYLWDNSEKRFLDVPYMNLGQISGAGAIISNVLDYAEWAKAMMRKEGPISPSGHEALVRPRSIPELGGEPTRGFGSILYSLGWAIISYYGETIIWHNGGLDGFGSNILYIPNRSWACVMFGNTAVTSNDAEMQLTWHLIDDLIGVPEALRANHTDRYELSSHI
jgi:CubicO group peptidase (beta-lactamase class C family)